MKNLIILLILFYISASMGHGKEWTCIIDGSQLDGKVFEVSYEEKSSTVRVNELLNDLSLFIWADNNSCIYQTKAREWFYLNVVTKEKQQVYPPANAFYGVGAPRSRKIAWVAGELGRTNSLILGSIDSKEIGSELMSTNGVIRCPSWSPDESKLVFYTASKDVDLKDGFTLHLIDFDSSKPAMCKEITPPSLPTRREPSRTEPPAWSANGKWILFEAQYSYDDNFNYYIVQPDGTHLNPSKGGTWSSKGNRILYIERDLRAKNEKTIKFKVHDHDAKKVEDISTSYHPTKFLQTFKWKANEEGFIYATFDKESYLLDLKKGKSIKILDGYRYGRGYWVN